MKSKSKTHWEKIAYGILLGMIACYGCFIIIQDFDPYWDEVVYMGYATYLNSGGEEGFREAIRPPGLPSTLAILGQVSLLPSLQGARVISLLFSLILVFAVGLLLREITTKRTAFIFTTLFVFNPIFLESIGRVLSGTPATLLAVVGIYALQKQRYFLTGVLAGSAFLFRFPLGVMVPLSIIIVLLSSKEILSKIEESIKVGVGASIPLAIFFGGNIIYYWSYPLPFFTKMVKPLLEAQGTVAQSLPWQTPSMWYYLTFLISSDFTLFLVVGAIVGIAFKIRRERDHPGVMGCWLAGIVLALYFSLSIHKEVRYALVFLVFLYGLSAWMWQHIDKRIGKWSVGVLLVIFVLSPMQPFLEVTFFNERTNEAKVNTFESLLEHSDSVLATLPFPVLSKATGVEYSFYSFLTTAKKFDTSPEYDLFVAGPQTFVCAPGDEVCSEQKNQILSYLIESYYLVFVDTIYNTEVIIFSKKINKEVDKEIKKELYSKYASRKVELAKVPQGKEAIVVFRIGGVGDNEKENPGMLVGKEEFFALEDMFSKENVSRSWLIIPKEFENLNDEEKKKLVEAYDIQKEKISIVQLGYAYTDIGTSSEFEKLPFSVQEEKIEQGKTVLEEGFAIPITTFVPPFNNADGVTLDVLEGKKYKAISTAPFDILPESEILRFDVSIELIDDWSKIVPKTKEQLEREVLFLKDFQSYLIIDAQHFYIEGVEERNDILSFVQSMRKQGMLFMNFDELIDWETWNKQVEFVGEGEDYILLVPSNQYVPTLQFWEDTTLSLDTNMDGFMVKNMRTEEIRVCINEECKSLGQKQYKSWEDL